MESFDAIGRLKCGIIYNECDKDKMLQGKSSL